MPSVTLDPAWGQALAQEIDALRASLTKARTPENRKVVARALSVFAVRLRSLLIDDFLGDQESVRKGKAAPIFRRKALDATARRIYEELYWPTWHLTRDIASISGAEKIVAQALEHPSSSQEQQDHILGLRMKEIAKERKKLFGGKESSTARFFAAYENLMRYLRGHRIPYPEITVASKDKVTLEGFEVELRGGNFDPEEARLEVSRLTRVLSTFRKRIKIVAPRFVDTFHKVRLVVDLRPSAPVDARGAFSEKARMIILYPRMIERQTDGEYVQTIAHELGHVVYHLLDVKTQSLWDRTIRGDMTKLSIADLLTKWPKDDEGDYLGAFELFDALKDSDPRLALQISALQRSRTLGYNWSSYEEFAEALHDQHIESLSVPQTPITGYANTDPEEAFCEAFGMLVAYGPRTIFPKVYLWLSTVLGSDVRSGAASGRLQRRERPKVPPGLGKWSRKKCFGRRIFALGAMRAT